MFDHAPDREGPRQQPRRTTRVAALEQRADAAGGDDLTLHRHRRHGIDREAVAAPEFGELRHAARAPLAEGEIVTRSEEHTSELQSLMRNSYAVFCLQKKKKKHTLHNILKHIKKLLKHNNKHRHQS